KLIVNELDRADVDTARWLCGDQHREISAHFPCDDDFLLVSARKRTRRERLVRRTNVECLDATCGVRGDAVVIERARTTGEAVLLPENEIVGHGVLEHESAPMTIL